MSSYSALLDRRQPTPGRTNGVVAFPPDVAIASICSPLQSWSSPCLDGRFSQLLRLVRHLLLPPQLFSRLEMRMQSVLCVKQVSRLHGCLGSPAGMHWGSRSPFSPSICLRRTESCRGLIVAQGALHSRRSGPAPHRSRSHPQPHTDHQMRAGNADLQDRDRI